MHGESSRDRSPPFPLLQSYFPSFPPRFETRRNGIIRFIIIVPPPNYPLWTSVDPINGPSRLHFISPRRSIPLKICSRRFETTVYDGFRLGLSAIFKNSIARTTRIDYPFRRVLYFYVCHLSISFKSILNDLITKIS